MKKAKATGKRTGKRTPAKQEPAAPLAVAETLWNFAKAQPGIRGDELHAKALAAGIGRSSIGTSISRMASVRKLLRVTGKAQTPDGREVLTYEAVGDAYPRKEAAVIAALANRDAQQQKREQPEAKASIQIVWEVLKDSPAPMLTREVREAAAARGVSAPSVDQFLHMLKGRKLIAEAGREKVKGQGQPCARYMAVGDAFPKTQRAASLAAHFAAKREAVQAPQAAPETAPAPVQEQAEAQQAAPAKGPAKRVFWNAQEVQAVCRRLARDHVRLGLPITGKHLAHIALMEGYGYRVRELKGVPQRDAFLKEHATLIPALVREERMAKAREEQAAQAPAQPSAPTPAAAPAHPSHASEQRASVPYITLAIAIEQAIAHSLDSIVQRHVGQLEGRIAQALEPLVKMISDAAARDRVRQLVGLPPLNGSSANGSGNGSANGHSNGHSEAHELIGLPAVETPPAPVKPPQVLIVNALPAQFESVKRAYPSLDLRLIENRMPAEPDPDLVISLTKFMSHPLDRGLRKRYGERYCPVNGAADSVKLAIQRRLNVEPAQRLH